MGFYQGVGRLNYDDRTHWVVLKVHPSIGFYYKKIIETLIWKKISSPLHRYHVTILAGLHEKPKDKNLWGARHGEGIVFEYSNIIETDGQYYWLPVKSDEFSKIRTDLGLSPYAKWKWHLTIGHRE